MYHLSRKRCDVNTYHISRNLCCYMTCHNSSDHAFKSLWWRRHWCSGNLQKEEWVQSSWLLQVNSSSQWSTTTENYQNHAMMLVNDDKSSMILVDIVILQAFSLQHFPHLQSRLCGYNPRYSNGQHSTPCLMFEIHFCNQKRIANNFLPNKNWDTYKIDPLIWLTMRLSCK